jgi:hypothetical protein
MTAQPIYLQTFESPGYRRTGTFRWTWEIRDSMTGPVLASGHTLTGWGAQRRIARAVRRCVCIAGVHRCDLPVRHPLTAAEAERLTAQLRYDNVPVTVRLDGPPGLVLLWPALTLTSRQQAHTLVTVRRATDAPVRWAGASRG